MQSGANQKGKALHGLLHSHLPPCRSMQEQHKQAQPQIYLRSESNPGFPTNKKQHSSSALGPQGPMACLQ